MAKNVEWIQQFTENSRVLNQDAGFISIFTILLLIILVLSIQVDLFMSGSEKGRLDEVVVEVVSLDFIHRIRKVSFPIVLSLEGTQRQERWPSFSRRA